MLRDSKISQSFTELEMLSEFTELLSEFTTTQDNSTLVFSIIVHGLFSVLTRNPQSKKLDKEKLKQTKTLHSLTQETTTPLKSMKLHFLLTLENGLTNTWVNTMSLPMICTWH